MDEGIGRMIEEKQLSLEELQKELAQLEDGSYRFMTNRQLREKISLVHAGYRRGLGYIAADTVIFRAVRVAEIGQRPRQQSQVSYPPKEFVHKIKKGRMNRVGEAVFYGSLSNYIGCMEECLWQPGELFALSGWVVREAFWINFYGYAEDVIGAITQRSLPSFTASDNPTKRNALLESWQSRIFKQRASGSDTEIYRLTTALREFGWGPISRDSPSGVQQLSGTMYPSVATRHFTENIALRTSEAASKLSLFEVVLLILRSREELHQPEGVRVDVGYYDSARPDSDGNLIWGQRSQLLCVDFSKVAPSLLKPNHPYAQSLWPRSA